jgi:hypothetical protein
MGATAQSVVHPRTWSPLPERVHNQAHRHGWLRATIEARQVSTARKDFTMQPRRVFPRLTHSTQERRCLSATLPLRVPIRQPLGTARRPHRRQCKRRQ